MRSYENQIGKKVSNDQREFKEIVDLFCNNKTRFSKTRNEQEFKEFILYV